MFTEETADSCTIVQEKRLAEGRKAIMYRHKCNNGDSYYAELADLNGHGYFRSGVSIWYYDNNFSKVRKRSTFWKGDEYGMVQEFYENGLIKLEGICKTIRYFPKHNGDKSIMCKVDLTDTTYFDAKGSATIDSINRLNKYCYFDSSYKYYKKSIMPKGVTSLPIKQPQKSGEWKYYDITGKLLRREYYTNGVLVQTISY